MNRNYCPQCPQVGPIFTEPTQVVNDFYHPQPVQVVHPVEVINQHHCVPVYEHITTCTEKDVMVSSVKKRKRSRSRK